MRNPGIYKTIQFVNAESNRNCYCDSIRLKDFISYRFLGTLNQYSGLNLFLPYDITDVGNGMALPTGLPIRKRKYNGGSGQALAGLGISSKNVIKKKYSK